MLPDWNLAGVLPPLAAGEPGHSPHRSPYLTNLAELVQRFGTSTERLAILRGLLAFRAELHLLGVTEGFQWLDGSFMEQIEIRENRPPKDIDAVTYFSVPAGETEQSLVAKGAKLFVHEYVKETYSVDHYPVVLGKLMTASRVKEISYWYSMWSHRRDSMWKGFVQVSLDPVEDVVAESFLASLNGSAS
ncbi:MAG: hypothetical protein V4754_07215 [Pseudomonadota bacterium]